MGGEGSAPAPLDRALATLDASGRMSGKTWDLAGQQLTEALGVGSPIQQNSETFAWWPGRVELCSLLSGRAQPGPGGTSWAGCGSSTSPRAMG